MDTSSSEKGNTENNLLIPGAIVVAGALVAVAVLYGTGGLPKGDTNVGGNSAGTAGVKTNAEIAADGHSLGNPEAPVVVVEFSDFQCPFCGRFHKTTAQQMKSEYVETGKVRFVYRHFAFLGQESVDAGAASECADEQGKFWEYHDYLFSRQSGENQGAFSVEKLKSFAAVLNLDTAKFNSCLDSGKYVAKVEKDKADGVALGVNATPTNFVNGRAVQGAVGYDQFKAALEQALSETKK